MTVQETLDGCGEY